MSQKTQSICHAHNLAHPIPTNLRFGIRVTLRKTDPFRNLVGSDWSEEHWFATAAERDQAQIELGMRHPYSRQGDAPSLEFQKLDK